MLFGVSVDELSTTSDIRPMLMMLLTHAVNKRLLFAQYINTVRKDPSRDLPSISRRVADVLFTMSDPNDVGIDKSYFVVERSGNRLPLLYFC
jgi:hypothetical protein